MGWSRFNSTISYLGGKRALIKPIFEHVPSPLEAPIFIDAFMGGGSVSLFAKAKGYQVLANDISERSHIIGRALIENTETKITEEDILRLFVEIKTDGFVEKTYGGKIFTRKISRFIDQFKANIQSFPDYKKPVMMLLLMKFCQKIRPFAMFTSTKNVKEIDEGNYESPLAHKTNSRDIIKQIWHPYHTLINLSKQINRGVFYGAFDGHINRGDVFEFIKKAKGDVAYFDPPYAESASYEETYKVLDSILAGKPIKPDISAFTKSDAIGFQDRLYESAVHIPHWVISMGQTDTKTGISPEELLEVVRKYKPKAKSRLLPHRWSINNSAKKAQKENIEYIIYTYEK